MVIYRAVSVLNASGALSVAYTPVVRAHAWRSTSKDTGYAESWSARRIFHNASTGCRLPKSSERLWGLAGTAGGLGKYWDMVRHF